MIRGVTFVLHTNAQRILSDLNKIGDIYGKRLIAAGMRSCECMVDIDTAPLIAGAKIQ